MGCDSSSGCCAGPRPFAVSASVRQALHRVAASGAPLLSFGQTVFWDEPTKTLLIGAMESLGLQIPVVFGIHDTDYFSKLPRRGRAAAAGSSVCGMYSIAPHNDGTTRELWAAVGEISALFASETPVSVRDLHHYRVPLRRLASGSPDGATSFIDRETEAWGWRGLVRLDEHDIVGLDVAVDEANSRCIECMVRWGLETTLALVADEPTQATVRAFTRQALCHVRAALARHHGRRLSRAFRSILTRTIEAILGHVPTGLTVTACSEYFIFNTNTAQRARFAPIDWFLAPSTTEAARRAYNQAVAGSGAYTLAQFGDGALPFDVVVPNRGRGTLRLAANEALVDLPGGTVSMGPTTFLRDRNDLAALVERRFGRNCMITAKAVVLPCLFLCEGVMVLNEGASAYIGHGTRAFVQALRQAGVGFRLFPILRLHYGTFDSLGALSTEFTLPRHLARAFGKQRITAGEFASRWRRVVAEQEQLLGHVGWHSSPQAMVDHIRERDEATWGPVAEEYRQVRQSMRAEGGRIRALAADLARARDDYRQARAHMIELERRSGCIRREILKPLWEAGSNLTAEARTRLERAQEERSMLQAQIAATAAAARSASARWRALRAQIARLDREGPLAGLRRRAQEIEHQVEMERFCIVRDALLTRGLVKADHRPSAWWMLALDGGRGWLPAVGESMEAYLEELAPDVLPRCWSLAAGGQ